MIKKLLRSLREYKAATIWTIVLTALETCLEVAVILLQALLIDEGITQGNTTALITYGCSMIGCVLLALVLGIIAGREAAVASSGYAKNLRTDMYKNIDSFSFSNIDKFSTAGLVTRLTTDVVNIQNAFMMIIRVAVRAPLMIIFCLIMSFITSARLAWIFLILVPILGVGLAFLILKARPHFKKVFGEYDRLNGVVQENLHGIRVVKSFNRESFERNKFEKRSETLYKIFVKAEGIMAYSQPFMQMIVYICLLVIYWLGAYIIVETGATNLTTGELSSLIGYANQILGALMMLSVVLILVTIADSSAHRIIEVLDETSDITEIKSPVKEVKNGAIVFDHVSFGYKHGENVSECLHDISLTIPSGATVGVIGATGSGKSSFVQLIPRLYDTTQGEVRVGGENVKDYDLYNLRDSVSMVLQKNVLFSGTIKENLRWGDENASDEELVHACKLACADEFITQFPEGYDTHIEQGGTNVSGGQKQRLCIARALLKKPRILILDDSTSAVDTRTDAQIRKAFREEIPDTTKIIISQRVSSVEDADMIIVLEHGEVTSVGTHGELLKTSAFYSSLYESQQKGASQDGNN